MAKASPFKKGKKKAYRKKAGGSKKKAKTAQPFSKKQYEQIKKMMKAHKK